MLKKRNRLSRSEFEHLLKRGRRLHSDHVSVVYSFVSSRPTPYPPQPTPSFKAGVVVSKKVARKAVERNRLRRLVYHTLEAQQESLVGMYVAVLLKKGAAGLEPDVLSKEIQVLLEKAHPS